MCTTTIIMLALLGLSVAEGLLDIWLLWKLCRKTEAIQTKAKAKTKTERKTKKVLLLIIRRMAKSRKEAYEKLKAENKALKEVLQNPEVLQDSKEQSKVSESLKGCSFTELVNLVKRSKNYEEILEKPLAVTKKDELSESNLGRILSDLQSLKSYAERKESDEKCPQIVFKSDDAKKILQPVLSDAKKFVQVKQYEPYFANIADATYKSFSKELPKNDDRDNVRILLMYLSQLYSISKIFGEICKQKNTEKSKEEIDFHRANVQPFCKKKGKWNDTMDILKEISSVKDKGEPFEYRGDDGSQAKIIAYLKKYKPLNFNLLGTDYSEYL